MSSDSLTTAEKHNLTGCVVFVGLCDRRNNSPPKTSTSQPLEPLNMSIYMVKRGIADDPGLPRWTQRRSLKLESLSQLWSEVDMTTEQWGRCNLPSLKRGPWAKECGQPLEAEKDKETASWTEYGPGDTWISAQWDPFQISELQNCKIIKFVFVFVNLLATIRNSLEQQFAKFVATI